MSPTSSCSRRSWAGSFTVACAWWTVMHSVSTSNWSFRRGSTLLRPSLSIRTNSRGRSSAIHVTRLWTSRFTGENSLRTRSTTTMGSGPNSGGESIVRSRISVPPHQLKEIPPMRTGTPICSLMFSASIRAIISDGSSQGSAT